jgi:hypothetical protein
MSRNRREVLGRAPATGAFGDVDEAIEAPPGAAEPEAEAFGVVGISR